MSAIKTVQLVYFSGTGGTARIAGCFEKAFKAYNIDFINTELNKDEYTKIKADFLVLLYPVYALNAPKPVDEWLSSAPEGGGMPAAVISVSGGGEATPNTACRAGAIRQLEDKGYDVRYETMFVMPSNVFISYDDALTAMLVKIYPLKAKQAVADILSGKRLRTRPNIPDRILTKLGAMEKKIGHLFAEGLAADNNCVGCSWCAAHCPRCNITMRNGRPIFGNRCVICLSCVYGCPKRAISPRHGKVLVLKQGYDLKAIEGQARQAVDLPTVLRSARGFLYKGVKKYIEENIYLINNENT